MFLFDNDFPYALIAAGYVLAVFGRSPSKIIKISHYMLLLLMIFGAMLSVIGVCIMSNFTPFRLLIANTIFHVFITYNIDYSSSVKTQDMEPQEPFFESLPSEVQSAYKSLYLTNKYRKVVVLEWIIKGCVYTAYGVSYLLCNPLSRLIQISLFIIFIIPAFLYFKSAREDYKTLKDFLIQKRRLSELFK